MSSDRTARALTPEEDAIGDPEDVDEEIDDLLPADLWFRDRPSRLRRSDW